MARPLSGLVAVALLASFAGSTGACASKSKASTGSAAGSGSGSAAGGGAGMGGGGVGGGASISSTAATSSSGAGGAPATGRGFPNSGPWVSFYGGADGVDLAKVAATFDIVNIDADPGLGGFTPAQIQTLRAGGKNRVLSYLDVGSCENFRSYYSGDPPGHKSCQSTGALTTPYDGYPDEMWANLSNAAYQDLIVNYVAANLAAQGVDGFFLDNLEVVEHGATDSDGPCDAACSQGGLDLVWQLRQKFPGVLIVMQNASSDVTRLGTTHGVAYPSLLDGLSHEEVYSNGGDPQAQTEMQAWRGMHLMVAGRAFWLGCEEYVGACAAGEKTAAEALYAMAAADGLDAYVTDDSGMQLTPCFWSDF